jgi:hypothetical protein
MSFNQHKSHHATLGRWLKERNFYLALVVDTIAIHIHIGDPHKSRTLRSKALISGMEFANHALLTSLKLVQSL